VFDQSKAAVQGNALLFKFTKGLKLNAGAGPNGNIPNVPEINHVALLGSDYPSVKFEVKVTEGDEVKSGQIICVDRDRPEIRFIAPAAGKISRISYGARRRLGALVISVEGNGELVFDPEPASKDRLALRNLLLESGAWTSLRSRPFGHIPNLDSCPSAIFITATDSFPLAVNPSEIITAQSEMFQRGAEALTRLTDGPVFVCQVPGPPLIETHGRLEIVSFSGPHPSGLPGTHIHHLMPVSHQRSVWQIGYQDVLAIGHLLKTGRIMTKRTLSIGGAGLAKPALISAPLGAKLAELVRHLTSANSPTLISGSILSRRDTAYLGRYDLQVTVLERESPVRPVRPFWHRLLDWLPYSQQKAIIPLEAFERVFPFHILPAPLMRSLAVGDVETAMRLGCLELLEEDLELLSWLCPSNSDYGALLRRALESLVEESGI
jgi:Na+-transporting NADH:ubiquinone oxidoreductase subunit A